MNNTVYLYVFDTMSDWEAGYLTAELNSGRYFRQGLAPAKIVTVGIEKIPVTTMGGLKIIPDVKVEECSIKDIDALILPGGNTWTEAIHEPILKIAGMCIEQGIVVGAICGATLGLAGAGLLDSRPHTSNDLAYLKLICHSYKGEEYYKAECSVTDGKLITASGVAPLEFSVHVLKALDVFTPESLDAWYGLNKTHESKYFYELMNSIQ
ncbi:type 1 glutamine amidotransferase family protein [Paenibacillus radicis (ex Gao et al. 2016)]|uniref:Protease YoaZ n=1 Tax=Paenibacillus radicis (ex Gao et al. 2016) TaxID=1737354 RepID=A0A917HAX8_9BACL|nr:type 1 glutamine amidotransferase family protein [Paenibacillus radicis (ex Gao et al. 2016)]GGG73417.1 putative protease YoaZ [Paenibacillus radicis (ex Gao et al. 2016)]